MRKVIFILVLAIMAAACDKEAPLTPYEHPSKLMIIYSCGQNNLVSYLKKNIKELMAMDSGAYVPDVNDHNGIVVCSHMKVGGSYEESGPTHIIRIYSREGTAYADTVATFNFTTLADKETMNCIFHYIMGKYDAKRYSIIFTSHGTGWMPQGAYETEPTGYPIEFKNGYVRSFGQERVGKTDYYIDIEDMVEAIPFHCDCILFDSCYMGGIETAYAFRNTTDYLGMSQAEVPSHGFEYKGMARNILMKNNPQAVLEDTFKYYDETSSTAVLSYVDCSKLENLARECKTIFDDYRYEMANVDTDKVQGFFTDDKHWFYDLEDILVQSGVDERDMEKFRTALHDCVLYSAFTPRIFWSVKVRTNCGFSMYLPCKGSETLDDFYRTLSWNQATGLVK